MANQSSTERGGSGNFSNDREKASEAGRKGGQHSHGTSQDEQRSDDESSQRGGSGNFGNDRERASEAGRKGGEHSRGGQNR